MLPTVDLSPRLSALLQPDWLGFRHALLRSIYAGLLVLVMLLPANFVAFALFSTLFNGSAFGGMHFAATHHLSGYWVGTEADANTVLPLIWWAAAAWEVLFMASCASALTILVLWIVRALAGKLTVHAQRLSRSIDHARVA
jgi:hypothetical protein